MLFILSDCIAMLLTRLFRSTSGCKFNTKVEVVEICLSFPPFPFLAYIYADCIRNYIDHKQMLETFVSTHLMLPESWSSWWKHDFGNCFAGAFIFTTARGSGLVKRTQDLLSLSSIPVYNTLNLLQRISSLFHWCKNEITCRRYFSLLQFLWIYSSFKSPLHLFLKQS